MTPNDLAIELGKLYESIKAPLDRTPEGLLGELDFRSQWLARSAELEAEAQFILDQKRGEVAERNSQISATMLREILARECADENRLYKLAERLNSTIVHQIEAVRSIVSYEKESRKHG